MKHERKPFTVWDFTSPSTGEKVRAVRSAEPGDADHQHEYQRIAWAGLADNKAHALALAAVRS